MSFLDKAKAAAQEAATKVQQGVEDVQAKRDLSQLYGDLGRTTYSLASRGEISHAELAPLVERISELEAQAGAGAATGAGTPGAAAGPVSPGEPGTPGAGAPMMPGEATPGASGGGAAPGAESAGPDAATPVAPGGASENAPPSAEDQMPG